MPLQLGSRTAVLDGVVTVEDAEPLTTWLRGTCAPRVNLRDCTHVHAAVLQAMLAARVKVSVLPVDAFLRESLVPVLQHAAPVVDPPRPTSSPSQEEPA